MCARGFAAVCDSSDAETLGPRPGVRPKGPQAEPGGRPRGPPLRGRREGNPGPVGLKERGCRTRRAGLGPAPTGEAEHRAPGGYVPPTVSGFHFSWADMHRSPHRIPAFRGGGYHPPAAPDSRPFVGAHSVRPRFRGCSRPPPTRKRWGRGPGRGTPQGAAGCGAGWPRGRVEGKGILNPAGGRKGRPYGAEGKGMADPAGRSGTGPYGVSASGPGTSLRPAR